MQKDFTNWKFLLRLHAESLCSVRSVVGSLGAVIPLAWQGGESLWAGSPPVSPLLVWGSLRSWMEPWKKTWLGYFKLWSWQRADSDGQEECSGLPISGFPRVNPALFPQAQEISKRPGKCQLNGPSISEHTHRSGPLSAGEDPHV